MAGLDDFVNEMNRRETAPAPRTFGEIWSHNWATGFQSGSPEGVDAPFFDAYENLRAATQNAYPDEDIEDIAFRRGLQFRRSVVPGPGSREAPRKLAERNIETLNALIDDLPEDKRPDEKLRDVNARAIEAAQKIERDAAEYNKDVYGLTSNAWGFIASAAGAMSSGVNLSLAALTMPIGGGGRFLPMIGREFLAGVAQQVPVTPYVQMRRGELGLEHGFIQGLEEVAMGGVTGAGLAATFRTTGMLLRGARNYFRVREAPAVGVPAEGIRVEAPPGAPEVPAPPPAPPPPAEPRQLDLALGRQAPPAAPQVPAARADPLLTKEDFAAAELLHNRDTAIYDQPARPPTVQGQQTHIAKVDEAGRALEDGRPQSAGVVEVSEAAPYPRSGDQPTGGGRMQMVTREGTRNAGLDFAPNYPGKRAQYFLDYAQQLIRATGERMTVRPMLVELRDLIASHDLEGRPIAAYPAELQPRDRSAPASRTWVAEKAARLEPELLGDSPTAGTGSPVIGPDGVVESGNGRVLLLQQAYARHPDRIDAYKSYLRQNGWNPDGFDQPVLVRMREGDLPMAERGALALEANVSATAGLSVRERAFADARYLDENLMAAHAGGEVNSAANKNFVRMFANQAVAPEERPNFIDANNNLSAEGVRRLEAALVARAWGEEEIVAGLYETADPTSKSILGAFADSAPTVARLRAAVEEGRIPVESDPTKAFVDGFRLVEQSRAGGPPLNMRLAQIDIETGAVPQEVIAAVRLYFRNDNLTQAAGRPVIAERIESSARRALTQANALGDLFGAPPTATATLRASRLVGEGASELPVAGPGPVRDANGAPQMPPAMDWRTMINDELDKLTTDAEKLARIDALTEENEPIVTRMLAEIDEKFGTKSTTSVKKRETIVEKTQRPRTLRDKPGYGIEHVTDTFRFMTELADVRKLPDILAEFERAGVQFLKRDVVRFFQPDDFGYPGLQFDLRMPNGQVVEYQTPVAEVWAAKKQVGNAIYDRWRSFDKLKATPAELAEYDADAKLSRDAYDNAVKASYERSGATESEVRAALNQASASASVTTESPSVSSAVKVSRETQTPSEERKAAKPAAGSQTYTTGLAASPKYADLRVAGDIEPSTTDMGTLTPPGKVAKPMGDPALKAEAERTLAQLPGGGADYELKVIDENGVERPVMAQRLLADVVEDEQAARELGACVGLAEAAE